MPLFLPPSRIQTPDRVAELRNWIAGWVTLAPYDVRISLDDMGEVSIYVRRSFRNYGVGRQLMRAIQEEAGKLGYRKLVGRILVENHDGLLLCRDGLARGDVTPLTHVSTMGCMMSSWRSI